MNLVDEPYQAVMQIIKASSNPSLTNNNDNYSLKGAEFGVFKEESCTTLLQTLVTDEKGKTEYYTLPIGTYFVKETKAPKGFELLDEVKKVVLSSGHDTNDTAVLTTITNDPYKMVTIRLGKRDGQYLTKLEGAEFTVFAWDGRSYSKVVGVMADLGLGQYEISFYHKDGVDGKYKVIETKNPEGYTGPWSQEFVVNENSDNEQAFSYDAVNYQEYKRFQIEVTKTDSVTGEALAGCEFTVYAYNGNTGKYVELGTLVWDTESKKYVSEPNEDLKDQLRATYVETGNQGKFRIVETKVPEGYVQSSAFSQDFVVSESSLDNQVFRFQASNEPIRIKVLKVDEAGKGILGAHLQVYDSSNTLVAEFDSVKEGTVLSGLKAGSYTLKETKVPKGYVKAEDVSFTVLDKAGIQSISMTDLFTKTTFLKLSSVDHDLFVEGASLELRTKADDPKSVVSTIRGEKVSFVSGKGEQVFYGIPEGSYYLVETKAPEGYALAEPILVSIKGSLTNRVVFYNAPFADLTIVKKIKANEINFANGEPTFLFFVTGADASGFVHTYSTALTFTKEYVDSHTGADGYVSLSYTWDAIAVSRSYEVYEAGVSRYYLSNVSSLDDNVTIIKGEKEGYGVLPRDAFTVKADLQAKSSGTTITFVNRKQTWGDYSHNGIVKNVIRVL